jgi:alginate O-acetyltransferase complex protein AlgI
MKFVLLWIIGSIFYLISVPNSVFTTIGVIVPLLFCSLCIIIFRSLNYGNFRTLIAYLLFFSISILSLYDFATPLTGYVNKSSNVLLFGFSFYTASLAYLAMNSVTPNLLGAFKIANPLLLATGPIALFIRNYSYRKLHFRVNYYLPFVIVGLFLFQIVGAPLVPALELINATDSVSSILFAVIFELFVYTNFCGLSLMLYGLFGIAGYKIPLNFKQPFSSSNIIEFWRGWHISLSVVLKLLFYSPLRKKYTSSVALLGVYLASAMWHGITYNFFIWGCFHALVFILTLFILKKNIRFLPTILLIMGVILGRLIFADSDIDRLMQKLLFSYEGLGALDTIWSLPNTTKLSLIMGFSLIAIEFFFRNTKMLKKRNYKHLRTPTSLAVMLVITIFLIDQGALNYAVYGQR